MEDSLQAGLLVRREWLGRSAVFGGMLLATACASSFGAEPPTPTPQPRPTATPWSRVDVRLTPTSVRLGQTNTIAVRGRFIFQGRPRTGVRMRAIVHYASGAKEYKAQMTTFQDGVATMTIPVAPAQRGENVRVEVVFDYQGGEYRGYGQFSVH